jgi:hypothetical protein
MPHALGGVHCRALGNPYRPAAGQIGSTLPAYHAWLRDALRDPASAQMQALGEICDAAELGPVELACWCEDPALCHASIVAKAVHRHLKVKAPLPEVAERAQIIGRLESAHPHVAELKRGFAMDFLRGPCIVVYADDPAHGKLPEQFESWPLLVRPRV